MEEKKAWSGRFKGGTDRLVEDFTASIFFDKRLYSYDIQGSLAHVKTLAKCKIVTKKEARIISDGLLSVLAEIEAGDFTFHVAHEDIHMNIEKRLIEIVGPVGGKLHTGRSRNDQVALDFRLFLRAEIEGIIKKIEGLKKALLKVAKKYNGTIMPGYTHLQMAQPILFSHHMLAYYDMVERDRQRFQDAFKRVNVMPLGSAALAGTNFPIDREHTAQLLNFPKITTNSLDGVGDRDFAIEFLSACAILMTHLSRFSEELILWSSSEFRFIDIDDSFCTGSSIMPQKKNPDVPELVRGKTGRVVGSLVSMLTMMKGLPLAYNKDLQEDKEPVFDAVDTVQASLHIFAAMTGKIKVNKKRLSESIKEGFMTAVDMADYLVMKKLPFRDAHEVTGKVVGFCLKEGKRMDELSFDELKVFSPLFKKDIFDFIKVGASVENKNVPGGTAPSQVTARIQKLSS
ncbi:MAG: argininosuccinate lyase [Nitrospinota bacterium]